MSIKQKCVSIFLALCMLIGTGSGAWAGSAVTLSVEPQKVQVGESLTVRGTAAADAYVSIKGLGGSGNVVYFNAVRANGAGAYSDSFKVPAIDSGTLTLVVGSGANTVSSAVTIYNVSSTTDTRVSTVTGGASSSVAGTIIVEAKSDSSGKATAAVTESQMSDAVRKAEEAATKQGEGTTTRVEIRVIAPAYIKTVETSLSKTAVTAVAKSKTDTLTIVTPVADITFDSKALDTIARVAAADVKISAAKVDAGTMNQKTKQVVGDRPVYNFSVTSGNNIISQFGGNVSVSVPYTPKAGEDTNAIVIYYINAQGKLETVCNCHYDPATGKITFTTNHFSQYAVGYNKVSFIDVSAHAWYGNAVGFIAARGITTGTGKGDYNPEARLTRGEFLVMMMRAYGIKSDESSRDNFADAGSTYYTGYLAAAKRLGITGGVGNNMFAPEKVIKRQEMFTLLYNALKAIGQLPKGNTGKQLTAFSDAGQVDQWAKEAMTLFAGSGTISGSGGMLAPLDTTTRAEMAQVLYNLLSK